MEENIEIIDTSNDRISQLLESVAHHILSLLDSPAELLRMTVFSNYWFTITASNPILDFNFVTFISALRTCGQNIHIYDDNQYARDGFFKYVEYTTCRFCHQNDVISAHAFLLRTGLHGPTQLEFDVINRCVGAILTKGVKVLVIDFWFGQYVDNPRPVYHVPDIRSSASSLASLTLDCCQLPSSFMVDDGFKLKSLRGLDLRYVHIDEGVIKRLTTFCPLLEEMIVHYCYGFKIFCVYGHQNLRKVEIFFNRELERIDIEAPNLLFLFLSDEERRGTPSLNLSSCKKLTKLHYLGYTSPMFADFSSSFPFLETLRLRLDDECPNLKLSSHSLRTFVLCNSCFNLEEIDINTPNLLSLDYRGHSHSPFPLERNSVPLKARMECHPIDNLWFQKLRRFLDPKVGFKELKLDIGTKNLIDIEELKMNTWRPFELEHVGLKPRFIKKLPVYVAVVEAVIWCCRPKSLTLESYYRRISFEEWNQIVKFTYEKLLEQENEGETNIRIVLSSFSSKVKKHFSNLNSLLTALPCDRLTQTITFIKEEVIFKKQE